MGISQRNKWSIEDSNDLYNIDQWSCGYFDIDDTGMLTAKLAPNSDDRFTVLNAVGLAEHNGLSAPLIVRFLQIIDDRYRRITASFSNAINEYNYRGSYSCYFPAKVNQHEEVIAAVIEAAKKYGGGVEAGTKPELLALLLMTDNSVPILCNGYKDSTIVDVAFRAIQLGRQLTIIIEKPSEVDLIAKFANQYGIRPRLGVRVKLAARSGGRWDASGGSRSKFGLSILQLQDVVARLKNHTLLDSLELLHFHPGSQVTNIRKIKNSLTEAARIYAELYKLGVPLTTIDVGGGLAVDYTGERRNAPSSRNYSLREYANDVVHYIQQVCHLAKVPEPHIISESGRWVAAHHSMIVIPVIDSVSKSSTAAVDSTLCDSHPVLAELRDIFQSEQMESLAECFHDTQAAIETVWQMFSHGSISLPQRTCAEHMASEIYRRIAGKLGDLEVVPPELSELRHYLAETYVANFSLFQALPDAWALDQLFPVVPLHKLDQRPTVRALIGDITCDSDGTISCFVGSDNARKSLPLHELDDQPYYLGIFLIGAYQEALSDDHNLLGDFHVLTIKSPNDITMRKGATTMDVLSYVHHAPDEILQAIENCTTIDGSLEHAQLDEIRELFQSVAQSYTYLSESSSPAEQQMVSNEARSQSGTHSILMEGC